MKYLSKKFALLISVNYLTKYGLPCLFVIEFVVKFVILQAFFLIF
jgi:hypothetical protein